MEPIQKINRLFHHRHNLYHLAPIPFIMYQVTDQDRDIWHAQLIEDAKANFSQKVLDVPDVKHIYEMGTPPQFKENFWSEDHIPAIGVWHRVPTNQYLSVQTPAVQRLRSLIEEHYIQGLMTNGATQPKKAYISESWIQFYSNGDYKVLHNHARYGPPYPSDSWAGAYYIDDGQPNPNMPYAGIFSFRIREENHFIKPKAGLLMIWPSDILHEVHPFYGSKERIVINFNLGSSPVVW